MNTTEDRRMTPLTPPLRELIAKWQEAAVIECNLTMSERRAMKRCADELAAALSAEGAGDRALAANRLFHRRIHIPEGEARDEYVADLQAVLAAGTWSAA